MGGGLTKEERKQVFYVFSKIDTSKAGHISIDNLKVPPRNSKFTFLILHGTEPRTLMVQPASSPSSSEILHRLDKGRAAPGAQVRLRHQDRRVRLRPFAHARTRFD
jgi:hypothetical protein